MEDQFAALHENPDMWVFSFLTASVCVGTVLAWLIIPTSARPTESSERPVVWCTSCRRWTWSCKMWSTWCLTRLTGENTNTAFVFLQLLKIYQRTSVNTCSFSTQAFWNGFRWTASGNHPQTPRQQTDAAVLGHAAQVTGGVRPSWYCLITVSVMTQSLESFFFLHKLKVPKWLCDFPGLTEPVLIRLDVDSKLSDLIKVNGMTSCDRGCWLEFMFLVQLI